MLEQGTVSDTELSIDESDPLYSVVESMTLVPENLYNRTYHTSDFEDVEQLFLDENTFIDLREKRLKGTDRFAFSWRLIPQMRQSAKKYNSDIDVMIAQNVVDKNRARTLTPERMAEVDRLINTILALGESKELPIIDDEELYNSFPNKEDLRIAEAAKQENAAVITRDIDFAKQHPYRETYISLEEYFDIISAPAPVANTAYQLLEQGEDREFGLEDVLEYSFPHVYKKVE